MESKKEALLLWLQAVSNCEVSDIKDLTDGKLIQKVLSNIEGFSFQ